MVGSAVGSWFQSRAWNHQNRVRLLEAEVNEMAKVFDEVSRRMDKRLYWTIRLLYTLKDNRAQEEDVKRTLEKHNEARYEWDASRRRDYALVETYFGEETRKHFEDKISKEHFMVIGDTVEGLSKVSRHWDGAGILSLPPEIEPAYEFLMERIPLLSKEIDNLNASMINRIIERRLRERFDGKKTDH